MDADLDRGRRRSADGCGCGEARSSPAERSESPWSRRFDRSARSRATRCCAPHGMAGPRVVNEDGQLVRADQVPVDGLLTVFPEHAVGAADAQAVLVRVDPVAPAPAADRRRAGRPNGLLAYSKVCYARRLPGRAVPVRPPPAAVPVPPVELRRACASAVPVSGPAAWPLPQLPLVVDEDGVLRSHRPTSAAPRRSVPAGGTHVTRVGSASVRVLVGWSAAVVGVLVPGGCSSDVAVDARPAVAPGPPYQRFVVADVRLGVLVYVGVVAVVVVAMLRRRVRARRGRGRPSTRRHGYRADAITASC